MKQRFFAKLNSRAGESIAETLIALLISALALVMLAGAVSSAANVVTKSKKAMAEYYAADAILAQRPASVTDANVTKASATVKIAKSSGDGGRSVNVSYDCVSFRNTRLSAKPVISYDYTPASTSGGGGGS